MSKPGSLGYQMMKALQGIFHPGKSRHHDKLHRRDKILIRSIGTMCSMSADVHQFARFVRIYWPEVNTVSQVTPEMAQAYSTSWSAGSAVVGGLDGFVHRSAS